MSSSECVLCEKREDVALVTFNRPDVFNALSREVNKCFTAIMSDLEADSAIKVIVLTGAGEKAFVAGGDIGEMGSLDAMGAREYGLQAKQSIDAICNCSKPVIAAINGLCLGGGLEYAMACDFRVASDNAKFGQPEINIGVMPGSAGTQRLPRFIGMGRAKELIFTGGMLSVNDALTYGLVNHIFPKDVLIEETMKIAKSIAGKSSAALALIKKAMNRGAECDIETGSLFEIDCFGLCFSTEEQKKGMEKFLKKKS